MDHPALQHLMGAYLHQDFDIFGTVEDNVDIFIIQEPSSASLVSEIGDVLARLTTEQQLESYLHDLGCQVLPPGGESRRDWLRGIERRALEGRGAARARQGARGPFPGRRPPMHASTFPDEETAEAAIIQTLEIFEDQHQAWLADSSQRLVLRTDLGRVTGRSVDRWSYRSRDVTGVHAVLRKNSQLEEGWSVHTAYPIPRPVRDPRSRPALALMVGAYFHQDWMDDYSDQSAAVRDFLDGQPTLAGPLEFEITEILGRVGTDIDLLKELVGLGCEFTTLPPETYRDWLTEVARLARLDRDT